MADEKLDALIFIDTNIFLDFYRIRKSNVSMKYLDEILAHKDIIITCSQIEMEFKKNRQSVILESIGELKKLSSINLSFPAIIANAQASKMLKKQKANIEKQIKKLKQRVEKILKNPSQNDPVYKSLQKVWAIKSDYNLNRENKQRFANRKLAGKRFLLGYPPRKKGDNSIGDAINWEWIIKCAEKSGKSIIIVSRDTDFGSHYEDESFLDDWLLKEFKERISRKRKILFTDKLSTAFKLVEIPVTDEMVKEERKVIDFSNFNYNFTNYSELMQRVQESMRMPNEAIRNIQKSMEIPAMNMAKIREAMQSLHYEAGEEE